jgi:predicted  nucleic acid-binding Zn-ribbon protein
MPGQLQEIVSLNEVLIQLGETEAKLAGIPEWMQELHDEHSRYQQDIDAVEVAIENARLERRAAEGEVSDAEQRQKGYQDQIAAVSTQREYGALLKEIDTAKQQIEEFEQKALSAITCQDEAQAKLDELRENFKDLDQRYGSELEKWESEKPSVAKAAKSLRNKVAKQEKSIPPAIYNFFQRLRGRYGDGALAQVIRMEAVRKGNAMWHCSGCSYRVRPQVVVEIRGESNVVQCDSCKRILFYVETEEQEA